MGAISIGSFWQGLAVGAEVEAPRRNSDALYAMSASIAWLMVPGKDGETKFASSSTLGAQLGHFFRIVDDAVFLVGAFTDTQGRCGQGYQFCLTQKLRLRVGV